MTTNLHSDAREQAEAVAKWMGMDKCHLWTGINLGSAGGPSMLKGKCGHTKCYPKEYGPPRYADSLDAMREVEDEIERRGLWEQYATRLEQVVGVTRESTPVELRTVWLGWIWLGARATALQRLAAAARVIEEVGNAG